MHHLALDHRATRTGLTKQFLPSVRSAARAPRRVRQWIYCAQPFLEGIRSHSVRMMSVTPFARLGYLLGTPTPTVLNPSLGALCMCTGNWPERVFLRVERQTVGVTRRRRAPTGHAAMNRVRLAPVNLDKRAAGKSTYR